MLNRRQFVGTAALTALGYSRVLGANEKLRVAAVGVGGKGWGDLVSVAASPHVQIVALCDVDESDTFLGRAAKRFPDAHRFTDWRKLAEDAKKFDACIVATPDHSHAPVALPMLAQGKHVYCEKPLTHTVFEARQMRLAAAKYKVVTQMGNQIQSHEAYRTAVKVIHDGLIGKVKEVISWQAGKMPWRLVDDRPTKSDPIPKGVHWNVWLGVAPERPFVKNVYHDFNWRAWRDFSNGQLGDFGCHILDPVFLALKLTAPTTIRAEAPPIHKELWTKKAQVNYVFPGTKYTANRSLPLTWYDGDGNYPPREKLGLPEGTRIPQAGSVLLGEKGTLLIPHFRLPMVFPPSPGTARGRKPPTLEPGVARGRKPPTLEPGAKIVKVPGGNHYVGWADACRGVGKATSSFDYSGPLTECVLLGTIAIRCPEATLRWDNEAMKLMGSESASAMLTKEYRKGWEPAWV